MSESRVTLNDGRVLAIQVDQIEVTSMGPRPDENWSFTDAAGHVHAHSKAGGYPTLTWVQDEEDYTVMEDGYLEEYPGSGHYECSHCGEHIEPGEVGPSPFREFIAGQVHYTLDGVPITEDQYQAVMAELFASR